MTCHHSSFIKTPNYKYKTKAKFSHINTNTTVFESHKSMTPNNNTTNLFFQTQINQTTYMPKKNPLLISRNTKYSPFVLYKKQLSAIQSNMKTSFTHITNQNINLKNKINNNPYLSFSFKEYLKNTKPIDPTMKTIQTEIHSLSQQIDQKGIFMTIFNNKSNINNAKLYSRVFVSGKKNNIYNKCKQIDILHPLSVLKFRKQFEKEYNIKFKNKVIKSVQNNTTFKFLQAYNKEVQFKNRIEEKYHIQNKTQAYFLTSI